jgi:peptidoglycan/xylan/chitin deacetylase (PgdA/CDA1 family)
MHLARIPGIGNFLFRDVLSRTKETDKVAYITFDDGPIPEVTPMVLDILAKYKAKATFFCVGDNVRKYPDIFKRLTNEGHTIGNHTFNHVNGWKVNDKEYLENVEKCAGLVSSNLFRPPYGKIKYSQYKKLGKKYRIVLWDVLSGDYDPAMSPEKCLSVVKKHTRPGSILVFHDNIKTQAKIPALLAGTLDFMKEEGYDLKALSPTI